MNKSINIHVTFISICIYNLGPGPTVSNRPGRLRLALIKPLAPCHIAPDDSFARHGAPTKA